MASTDPQVPWTDEQWARIAQAVQKEAARSRVAASFLPLVGPLPPDTDYIKGGELTYLPLSAAPENDPPMSQIMGVDDRAVVVLASLQVRVQLRGAQVADPQLTSALELFRRAANVLARLEDAIVFRGQQGVNQGPPPHSIRGLPAIWRVTSGFQNRGLHGWAAAGQMVQKRAPAVNAGRQLVQDISTQIGELEGRGHYGPFAVVLGEQLFGDVQDPTDNLVLPSDRVIPFLGGGPLLRSSTLPDDEGIIVALGAAPFELVIATDVSVGFLQVDPDPAYIFRVHEKIALRVKEPGAIGLLKRLPPSAGNPKNNPPNPNPPKNNPPNNKP
jgi:uncharacterized linocin/CFP29 family protein